jgi:hypothetical protein
MSPQIFALGSFPDCMRARTAAAQRISCMGLVGSTVWSWFGVP